MNSLPDGTVDSVGQRMTAGGTVGWLIGQPLFVGVTAVPAIILLVLLGAFGVLLISGIPLVEVPGRIRDGFDRLRDRRIPTDENGEYPDDYRAGGEVDLDAEADLSTTRLRRPSRRRQALMRTGTWLTRRTSTLTSIPAAPTRPIRTSSAAAEAPTTAIPVQRPAPVARQRVVRPAVPDPDAGAPPVKEPTQLRLDQTGRLPAAARRTC